MDPGLIALKGTEKSYLDIPSVCLTKIRASALVGLAQVVACFWNFLVFPSSL